MYNIKTSSNKEFQIVVLIIVIVQGLLSFQGFDVCDEGFSLTFYQQIYNAPSSVEYNFVYWLSGIVGGIWYHFYEEGGILWFRILTIIFNTLTFIVCYQILKQYINKRYILIGLTMVLFVNDYGYLLFYHNHLTALLAVVSIYFLHKGLEKKHHFLLGLAGLIIGINVFSRLPNITLFVFILVIPFWGYLNKKRFKESVMPMLIFILGIAAGFITVYITLYGLDQIDTMKNAVLGLFDLGKTEGSSHNVKSLFYTYIHNYRKLLVVFCELLIASALVLSVLFFLKINRLIKVAILVFMILLFTFWLKKTGIYLIYTIGYIGTLGILITKQKNVEIKTLAFLVFLMMLFLPLGSGGGIKSSGYMCIWLAIPLFFYFISQLKNIEITFKTKYKIISKVISKNMIKYLSFIFLMSYVTIKTYSISQEAYFDKGSRLKKTYKIHNKYTKGIYTTKERAEVINELLVNLEKYVKPNDYLFTYDKIPMIHFLTETKPYTYNPWIWIYDSYSFKKNIDRAEKEIDILPIIVQQKFETIFSFSEPTENYLTEHIENDFRYNNGFDSERVKTMNLFILRNEYEIVWSNTHFNIYKSHKHKK